MMRKLQNITFLVIFLMGTVALFAQQPVKLGHIDTNELLRMMPGRDSAQVQLERYARELETTFTAMQTEFQTKYQDYLEKQATFSDLIRQSRERELMSLQERIQDFQESAQQDLAEQENRLFSPIIEQVRNAISTVAKENGYTYVLDISMGVVLFHENGDNILPLVKQKLGI